MTDTSKVRRTVVVEQEKQFQPVEESELAGVWGGNGMRMVEYELATRNSSDLNYAYIDEDDVWIDYDSKTCYPV